MCASGSASQSGVRGPAASAPSGTCRDADSQVPCFNLIYFWPRWVSVAACGLPPAAVSRRPLLAAVRGPLTAVASLCCGARAPGARASAVVARGLSSCGAWAQLLRGLWDIPGPGLEPVSPALAGRFLTTAPPGKPPQQCFNQPRPCLLVSLFENHWLQVRPIRFLVAFNSCPRAGMREAADTDTAFQTLRDCRVPT